jgi:sugar (pentulose or hexulose) kinase
MLADILNRAVGAVQGTSPAAVGAAILARRIAGVEVELDRQPRSRPWTKPDESSARCYAGLYRQYLAHAALCE